MVVVSFIQGKAKDIRGQPNWGIKLSKSGSVWNRTLLFGERKLLVNDMTQSLNAGTEPDLAALFAPQKVLQNQIQNQLNKLRGDIGARCVFLVTYDGCLVAAAGVSAGLNVEGISALVAANFMAAAELARLLDNGDSFSASHFKGACHDIYTYAVDSDYLLAVMYGQKSLIGIVNFCVRLCVGQLRPPLARLAASRRKSLIEKSAVGRPHSAAVDDLIDGIFH